MKKRCDNWFFIGLYTSGTMLKHMEATCRALSVMLHFRYHQCAKNSSLSFMTCCHSLELDEVGFIAFFLFQDCTLSGTYCVVT